MSTTAQDASAPPSGPVEVRAEVTLRHPATVVYAALSDADARARWSAPPEAEFRYLESAFVIGGRDVFECRGPGGTRMRGEVRYVDLDPGRRVVYEEALFDFETQVASATVAILLEATAPDTTRVTMTAQLHAETPLPVVDGYRSGLRAACAGLARWLGPGAGGSSRPRQRGVPMSAPYPCIWFQGSAQAAVDFYLDVFHDARIVNSTRYPEGLPGEPGSILTIAFEIGGQPFLALNAGPEFALSPAVSFVVECDGQAEIDRLWDRLSDGGQPMPCGWVTDRFGVTWQIVPRMLPPVFLEPDSPAKRRVVAAMMTMTKLDIAVLRDAKNGGSLGG